MLKILDKYPFASERIFSHILDTLEYGPILPNFSKISYNLPILHFFRPSEKNLIFSKHPLINERVLSFWTCRSQLFLFKIFHFF